MLLQVRPSRSVRPLLAAGLTALLAGACAQDGSQLTSLQLADPAPAAATASAAPIEPVTQKPLAVAALPADMTVSPEVGTAIRKARALRQSNKKKEALELLDKTAGANKDIALISERGLLALELGQVEKAEQLLARAQDPKRPDWRLQSAYGAALSANGKQQDAQAQFAKALAHAPDQPSILNNLALSYALDGKHEDAERILRQAASHAGGPETKQNLALILGLKGKTNEAKALAQTNLPPEKAEANMAYFERIGTSSKAVSRADPVVTPPMHQASYAGSDTDKPIMQLGAPE